MSRKVQRKLKKKYTSLFTTRIIMIGFLVGIILGTVLLSLPISLQEGQDIKLVDALFVAVSSICVTGLSTVNVGQTFSFFGQAVLLCLIQIGGLGVITFVAFVLITAGKRISLSNRLLLQNAYNTDTLSGLIIMTKRIVKVTLIIEGIGAILCSFVFVPEYGPKGIWYSIFHAVSAFCNAGIDLFGGNSLCMYRDNVLINATTIALIIVSGLGFPVYWEIERLIKESRLDSPIRKMSLQAKLVLITTAVLVLGGAILTLIFEWDNPDTIGTLSFPKKCMASLFQSVTLRTAGFATIDQGYFRESSCTLYLVMMLIGGSPAGTAGGIKTVTFVIVMASMISNIKGSHHVNILGRKVSDEYVRRCVAIAAFSLTVLIVLTIAMFFVNEGDFLDTIYEMVSAIATVGLSRGLTGSLPAVGKIIVCMAMYLGRIGPITLALAFNYNDKSSFEYSESKIIVG